MGDIHDSVACCGLGRVPFGGQNPEEAKAGLVLDQARGTAAYRGVTRCASPWACPVCAPKIAAARAEALKPQVVDLMGRGYTAWLITLTLRHDRKHGLADLFDVLGSAWGRVTSGKRWNQLRATGAPEYARGYDLTWSNRHGWHPHVHLSLYLPPEHGDGEEAARWILSRWMEALAVRGWEALPDAQHCVRVDDPEKAAAYAVTPAAVYESVALAMKRERTGKAGSTPFEILGQAVEDCDDGKRAASRAVMLWREYVTATKGRRQVTTSRGLTLKDDADLPEDTGDLVAVLGRDTVQELDRKRLAAPLLDAVEWALGMNPRMARDCALDVLRRLSADDWRLMPVPGVRPDPGRRQPPNRPDRIDLEIAW